MSKDDCTTLIWAIHNYSYCWQENNEAIVSPIFRISMPEETKWKLLVFPRGVTSDPDCVAFFLYREKDCSGPETIHVKYSLDILNNDGNSLAKVSKADEFQKGMRKGSTRYVSIINKKNGSGYFQQDILTFQCKLINFNGKAVEMSRVFVRAIIGIEERCFHCPIENFSSFAQNQKQSFIIKFKSKDIIMLINLAETSENEENISFGIDFLDQYWKFSVVKAFIIDSNKQEVDSGEYEYWPNCKRDTMFQTKLTKKKLIENESLYLPNDVLTLIFKFTIVTGFAFEGREKAACECTLHPFPNEVTEDWRKCVAHKSMSDCPCALITDLSSLYKDQSTCDMKLQTKTNEFPVHTLILSARSPVFKAMFSNDMKEKMNGCVDVSDLEDETVRRFLFFLYSDQLEDLKWDNALQLYKAADKYAVISLRDKCSTFLKNNLNTENACESLLISDLHQDKDLKEISQNFILRNAKLVFKSEEWQLLADNNPKLALETALRNWNEE